MSSTPRHPRRSPALLAALTLLLGGCFSSTTLTTATPIGADKVEFFVSPNFTGPLADGPQPVPNVDLGLRFGATDWLDVGVTVHSFMLYATDVKLALLDTEWFALALDPSVGLSLNALGELRLPVLLDVKFGEAFKLSLGGQYKLLFNARHNEVLHVAGGMIAVELRVGGGFYLMPHLALLVGLGDIDGEAAGVIMTTGVAAKIRFGGSQ